MVAVGWVPQLRNVAQVYHSSTWPTSAFRAIHLNSFKVLLLQFVQYEDIQGERTENRRLKQVINKLAYDNEALGNEMDQEKAEMKQTQDTLATVEVRR